MYTSAVSLYWSPRAHSGDMYRGLPTRLVSLNRGKDDDDDEDVFLDGDDVAKKASGRTRATSKSKTLSVPLAKLAPVKPFSSSNPILSAAADRI